VSPLAGRIAGAGLATAALAIALLAALLHGDMSRETRLARDIQAIQEVKNGLESLKEATYRLRFAASAFAWTRDEGHARDFGRERVAIEADLEYLRAKATERADAAGMIAALEPAVRDYLDQAGLALRTRAGDPVAIPPEEAGERLRQALRRANDGVSHEINRQTNEQIQLWANRDAYVRGLLVGTIVVLVGLAVAFRQSQVRARADRARIEQLAHFDSLTGLANRSLLEDRLSQAMALAHRNAAPLAVLLFDLDGFKGVNDTLGHSAGDRLLVQAAARAGGCVRASDTVGRLGGDEFLAILPDTDRDGARAVALKLLEAMALPFDTGAGQIRITASVGGGFLPGRAHDGDALVGEADSALYASKRGGRNRYSEGAGRDEEGPAASVEKAADAA
jgi:diguanylate cyclase